MFLDGQALPTLSALQLVLDGGRIGRPLVAVTVRRGERLDLTIRPSEAA